MTDVVGAWGNSESGGSAIQCSSGQPVPGTARFKVTHWPDAAGPWKEKNAFGPCRPVVLIVVPGTAETQEGAAPDQAINMLANVTDSLGMPDSVLRVHYIGYPASLAGYFTSEPKGAQATWTTIKYYSDTCKKTKPKFILLGYSQGAHIAGDVAQTIGKSTKEVGTKGGPPISSDRLLGTFLLADPRRDTSFEKIVGMAQYEGADGIYAHTKAGPRGDFGKVSQGVTEYCLAHDPVCDSAFLPSSAGRGLAEKFFRASIHLSYNVNLVPGKDQTFTARIAEDVRASVSLGMLLAAW